VPIEDRLHCYLAGRVPKYETTIFMNSLAANKAVSNAYSVA